MKTFLASVLVVVAFATASNKAADKDHHSGHTPMAGMIQAREGDEFEAAFLGMMILHHKAGQPMWAMAREKATDEGIKELEKKTTPKEKEEIEKMTSWLQEWHSKTPSDFKAPAESKKTMEKDMAELKAAQGKEFDASFATKMAHHHRDAIAMGELAAKKAQHDEVKQLGSDIAGSQEKDRQKLERIAKDRQ